MGPDGHRKIPQIGRVIIQDDVEIGAGTSIDRGGLRDTVIGEGTKIDNQVQIGHNVVIGRHCVLVAQVGIAGSVVLEDYVVLGGTGRRRGPPDDRRGRQDRALRVGVMSQISAGAAPAGIGHGCAMTARRQAARRRHGEARRDGRPMNEAVDDARRGRHHAPS